VPTLIVIAGPNGAGKTTFASEYLSAEERRFEFINADRSHRSLETRSTMSRGLDITKAEAALKRAAHKALHGTREERSGRFLPKEKRQSAPGARRDAPKDLAKRKA
jgi:dephospho-CoA kinase